MSSQITKLQITKLQKPNKYIMKNNTAFQKLSRPQVSAMEHKELIDSIMEQTPTLARIGW